MIRTLLCTRLCQLLAAAALLLVSSFSAAQTSAKHELAAQFFAASNSEAQLVAVAKHTAHATLLHDPNAAKLAPIYEQWLLKVFRSDEYAKMQIQVYLEQFSAEELELLVSLTKHPGFPLYASRLQQVLQVSATRLLPILRARNPELRAALEATGVWPAR